MRILRAADRAAAPWKNGGGVTREVAVWPPNAGFDDFDWRVSIADVHEAGPFSTFAGIDRMLMILEGRMSLTVAGRAVELDSRSAPFAFPGDVACSGRPLGGRVTDLNVMARRGRCLAHVERIANATIAATAKTVLVASASTMVRFGTEALALERFDAALIDGPGPLSLDGAAFAISLEVLASRAV